jgi:hypothetical protein
MEDDEGFVCEDDCVVCGRWPKALRPTMREGFKTIWFKDLEQICAKCIEAFWKSLPHQKP